MCFAIVVGYGSDKVLVHDPNPAGAANSYMKCVSSIFSFFPRIVAANSARTDDLNPPACYVPPWTSWHEVFWLMRPVAIAGASGGFASLVLTVLRDSILQGGAGDPFRLVLSVLT